MRKIIIVKTQFEATHCWPECNIPAVSFLKNEHRHLFYVKVALEIKEDRQVEFLTLKKEVEKFTFMNYRGLNLGSKSCEVIAEEIFKFVTYSFESCFSVQVFEDNENGAEVWS